MKIERNFPTPFMHLFQFVCLSKNVVVEYTFNKENVYFLHTKVEHIKGEKSSNRKEKDMLLVL